MDTNPEALGLKILGDMTSGNHSCLFYETEHDLLESLAVYFKTGLANGEFCLWITSLSLRKSKRALKVLIPSAEQHLKSGQMELLSSREWFLEGRVFDAERVTRKLEKKIKQIQQDGYSKLRVFADVAWMNDRTWMAFSDYEATLDHRFAKKPVKILCAYPTTTHNAAEILDVARTHRFVAAKRNGIWEILETPEMKHIKTESRIIDSEYRLQAAIDAADIGIWTLDMNAGRVVSSGHHDAIFGFAPGEFDGTLASLDKRIHADDLPELKRLVELARERGSEYSHEYRVVWPDGSLHWVQGRGRFVKDELDGSIKMVGAVLDITERRRMEASLRKSERVLREAELLGHTGSWEQDLVTREIFNSEANQRLFFGDDPTKGADLEDYFEVVHPDDRAYVMKRRTQLLAGGPPDIEYRVVWPDGTTHVIFGLATVVRDASGKPVRVFGTNVEITERKKADEALRVNEAKLKEAHQLAKIGYFERDPMVDRITWSEESTHLFGLESFNGVMTQAQLQEIIHPDDRNLQEQTIRQALQDFKPYDLEYRIVNPEGGYRHVHVRAQAIRDDTGRPIRLFAAVQDVTERRQAEEAQRRAEDLFRAVVEDQTEMIVRWKPDGTRTFVNQAYCRTFGKSYEELVGTNFWPLVAEPYRQSELERIQSLTPESPFSSAVHESLLPDGTTQWQEWRDRGFFDRQGRLVELQSVGRDITERRLAEEALRVSEAKLKEAQELARIGYWERDLVADRITPSEETRKIFGKESPFVNAAELEEMVYPEDRQLQRQALSNALEGKHRYDVEYRILRSDGKIRFVHVRDDIEYDNAGQPVRLFGTVQDITERKLAEQQINQHAARMETLAEISRTFAEVGLDYQNVLATVARRIAELTDGSCVMTLFSDDAQRSFPVAFHHPDPKARALMHAALLQDWQGGTDTARYQSLLAGNSIFLPEAASDEFRSTLEPEFQNYFDIIGISGVIIVPLRIHGRVIGTLGITRDRNAASYTHDDELLLRDLADRAALTIENARLFEQVQGAHQTLQTLSSQLLVAQEEERRTIARELHDDIGQRLTGLMMQLGMAKNQLPKSANSVRKILEQAEALIQEVLQGARSIMAGLRPQALDDLGLVPALRRLAEEFQQDTGVRIEIKTTDLEQRLPAALETALFRILQEALTNVRKHARADVVRISLAKEDDQVVLSVEDDGRGFEKQADQIGANGDIILDGGWRIPAGHFGLIGIQERAVQLNGRLDISSAAGKGTTLRVELPLSKSKAVASETL